MGNLTRQSIRFSTSQTVYVIATADPYVGFEHLTDIPSGWEYDIKRWASPFDLLLPSLPRLANASRQKLQEAEYFDSGVGDTKVDLEVIDIDEFFVNHERHWIPEVNDGWYFRHGTDYFYYGDNSRIQTIDPSLNVDGRNYMVLDSSIEPGKPITAASYKRDPETKAISYDVRLSQVGSFTGRWEDGEQLNTTTSAGKQILWDNIDTTKKEFVVDTSTFGTIALRANADYTYTIGVEPTYYGDLGSGDILGVSDYTEWQVFFLKRFPVVTSSIKVYAVDTSTQTWTECTRTETFWELFSYTSDPSGTFNYFLDKDLGRIIFGGLITGIPTDGYYIVATYDVTLRVEYEEEALSTQIHALDANVSPTVQSLNEGFVCITHEEIEAAKIELSIAKEAIPFINPLVYGPIYVGADWATLQATVTSATGTVVPNVEITFSSQPSTLGFLGGSSIGIAYSVTNGEGIAYTYYQPPVDADSMGYYATAASCVHGDTLYLDNTTAGLTVADDIYLYKVLKDDPLLGATNLDDFLPEPPSWVTYGTDADYERWKEEMIQTYDLESWAISPHPNGRKVVIYQWDSDAINPVLGTSGAYVPTRPVSIDTNGGQLTYPSGALLPSNPYYPAAYPPYFDDIGAYWVVSSKYIEFQASCWSEYYNRIIYSNTIKAKIMLPRYLLGEYVTEQLYKIPFGWKLTQGDDNNHAAGLNGATFLCINPTSGPYNIIDFITDSNDNGVADFFEDYQKTGYWASIMESSVSFKFSVGS